MIADFHHDFLTEANGDLSLFGRETVISVCALFRGKRNVTEIFDWLEKYKKEHRKNQYLALEDCGYLNEELIEKIECYKPLCATLTWNLENELAGGCLSSAGLKKTGSELVKRFDKNGIFVDCAHLNEKSFYQVLEHTDKIVDSHTCCKEICDHPRNLSFSQVKEIVLRRGLIGITFVGKFLKSEGQVSTEDVFIHTDTLVQKFGIRSFCFGSDFYGTEDLPSDLKNYFDAGNLRLHFENAGYKSKDIDAIFFQNLEKFVIKNNGIT